VHERGPRLFVAVELAAGTIAAAGRMIEQLQERVARQAPAARVRWVDPERLHVTLQFMGEVPQTVAERIRVALEPPLPMVPFDVVFSGIGVFPARGAPRVVWAGVGHGGDGLRAVNAAVVARLGGVGLAAEGRPFAPHLTLGRVRRPQGLRAAPLCEGLSGVELGSERVEAITLMESRLSPRGPAYVGILRTRLAG
jgi:RNA 2',3'-cyclic 3'-phosphodiesterase